MANSAVKEVSDVVAAVLVLLTLVFLLLKGYVYITTDQCTLRRSYSHHKKFIDNNRFFTLCDGNVYVLDSDSDYFRLEDYDKNSFEVLPFSYAKDKNNVYYVNEGNDMWGGSTVVTLSGADPATFKVLRDGMAVDKDSLFYDQHNYGPK